MPRPPHDHFEPCQSTDADAFPIWGMHYRLRHGKAGMEILLDDLTAPDQTGSSVTAQDAFDGSAEEIKGLGSEITELENQLKDEEHKNFLLHNRIRELSEQVKDLGGKPVTPAKDSIRGDLEDDQ